MKKLDVKRLIELEEMIKNDDIEKKLTVEELMYITRATIIPYNCMIEIINYYKQNWYKIDEVQFKNYLKNIFKISDYELDIRFKDVHSILRYKNKELNNLVNKQKKMIKIMKRR